MFVINRVVLERFEERAKVMGLANENTIVAQENENSRHDVVNIFDVGEDVRRRDNLSFSLFSRRLLRDSLLAKQQLRGISRLFCRWRTNDRHRIHGREIAEE